MSKYTLNLVGKTKEISKKTGFLIVIPVAAFWLSYMWCLCGGVWRFGETIMGSSFLTLLTTIIIFSSIKINDVRYGVLPETKLVQTITRILCVATVLYYFYHVYTYGF